MSRSGHGVGRPPRAITAAGTSPAVQPGESGFDARAALGMVGLGIVGHVLRSRRTWERLVVAAIAVEALRRMGQDNRASMMESLKAWDKRQIQRMERQPRVFKSAARMARSGRPRGLAGTVPGPDDH